VPLTASDFVYSWKRLLSPLTGSANAYLLFDVEGAEAFNKGTVPFEKVGIKAVSDRVLRVQLARPNVHWTQMLAEWPTFPLRKDVVDSQGEGWASVGRMVTLGPFILASHDWDAQIVLKQNPYYTRKRGNIDEVVALVVKDDALAFHLYEAKKIDYLTGLTGAGYEQLEGRKDFKNAIRFRTSFLGLMTGKYPTSNVKLRRAIAMAIDKKKMISLLHKDLTPASSLVPPSMLGYSKSVGLSYDPIHARQQLRGTELQNGGLVKLEYILPDFDKTSKVANFIREELRKNLGFDVLLKPYENKVYRNQLDFGAADLFDYTWTANYPDPDNPMSLFLSTSKAIQTDWKNQKYDEGVFHARNLKSVKDRERIYIEMQKILLEEEAVIVPLYYGSINALIQPRVNDYQLNPLDTLYLRMVNVE
jgi:ABC-type oligopeptide transport system substrate-binding subunit